MPSYYIVLERTIPNFDVYVNGNMLAKESDTLERLAKKSGVTPLLSFFSIDSEEVTSLVGDEGETIEKLGGKAPKEQWFSAEDGLRTVRALVDSSQRTQSTAGEGLIAELREFERVLVAAHGHGIGWHLGIDY
jgi:hypothetical protein